MATDGDVADAAAASSDAAEDDSAAIAAAVQRGGSAVHNGSRHLGPVRRGFG